MTSTISFTFNKGLQTQGALEAHFNGAQIDFSSTKASLGTAAIFEKIKARNEAVYEQVHSLKNYTLSLTPIPNSPNIALQIVSQKLIVNAQLTPETGARLLTSIRVLPPEFTPYFQPGQNTISSNEKPSPDILATLFQRIRTLFSMLFSPKERPQPKPSLAATPAPPLTIPVVEHKPQPGQLPLIPVENDKDFFNDADLNLFNPETGESDDDDEGLVFSDARGFDSDILSEFAKEPIIQQTIATAPLQPSSFEILKNFFKVLFPNTQVNGGTFFGEYFFDRILPTNDVESCNFDIETGKFVIRFNKEKQIVLENLPEGGPRKPDPALKKLLGTTLCINKIFTGRIDHTNATIEFDEGVLTAKWVSCFKKWSAHMLSIAAYPDYPTWLIFDGKIGWIGKTCILAQDFVDLLECNLS